MAIKVKHEGNVTSRVVAANMGGQAESSQKQALSMAQKSAGENAAANRQLQGAHASAPNAPTSSAQLTHASPGSIAAPKYDPRYAEFMVTGVDPNKRPDDISEWDSDKQVWKKRQRPGDYDADALARRFAVAQDYGFGNRIRANIADIAKQPSVDGAIQPQPPSAPAPVPSPQGGNSEVLEVLQQQKDNAIQALASSVAQKARGFVPGAEQPSFRDPSKIGLFNFSSLFGGNQQPQPQTDGGSGIGAGITPPAAPQTRPLPDGTPFDFGGMYGGGGKFYGQGGAVNNNPGGKFGSTFGSVYDLW